MGVWRNGHVQTLAISTRSLDRVRSAVGIHREKAMKHPITVHVSADIHAPKNGRPVTVGIVHQAIVKKTETGLDVPGITLRLVDWQRGRASGKLANTQDDWIRLGRVLQEMHFSISIRRVRSA